MAIILSERQKVIIIVYSILVVSGIIAIMLVMIFHGSSQPAKNTEINPISTYDSKTGRTYLTHKGLSPEPQVQSKAPSFSGFGVDLINEGISLDQISALQQALQKYVPFAQSNAQIILDTSNIVKVYPEKSDPQYRWSVVSNVDVIGIGKYHIKFYYSGTSNVQLLLYDKTGATQLFDSGIITGHAQ